jgi:hypothetical protein
MRARSFASSGVTSGHQRSRSVHGGLLLYQSCSQRARRQRPRRTLYSDALFRRNAPRAAARGIFRAEEKYVDPSCVRARSFTLAQPSDHFRHQLARHTCGLLLYQSRKSFGPIMRSSKKLHAIAAQRPLSPSAHPPHLWSASLPE